ncbi:MAG: hypothetical protein ACJ8F3_02585 [Xanthobacteraceae bacterium]
MAKEAREKTYDELAQDLWTRANSLPDLQRRAKWRGGRGSLNIALRRKDYGASVVSSHARRRRALTRQGLAPLDPVRADAGGACHVVMRALELARLDISKGGNISALLERSEWKFRLPTICIVNGVPVLRSEWASHDLHCTDQLVFLSRPMGGGSSGSAGK